MERKPAQLKSTRTPRLGEKAFPRLMITPTLAVLIILTAYPLIFTFLYSFTDYNYLKGPGSAKFVFLKSYISLFQNAYFRQAVLNTIKFTLLAVTLEMVFGLLVAVFVNSLHHGQKTVRTLLLLPYLLPAVTVALSWKMMLSSNYGIVNQALSALGLPVYNWFMDSTPEVNVYMEYANRSCLESILQLLRDLSIKVTNLEITRSSESGKHNSCAIFTLQLNKRCTVNALLERMLKLLIQNGVECAQTR